MKTTVEIEDRLLRQVKKLAIDRGCTLRQVIEICLRREVAAATAPHSGAIRWVTASGRWPQGLDISSREKMWEWLESDEGAEQD